MAKASFLELLLDYEDFHRVRNLRQWEKDSREVRYLLQKAADKTTPDSWFADLARTRPADTAANMAIVLLHQEDFLLQAQ